MSDFVDRKTQQKQMDDGDEDCSSSVSSDFERIPNTPLDGGDEQQQQADNMNMEEHKTPLDSADGFGLGDDQKKASSNSNNGNKEEVIGAEAELAGIAQKLILEEQMNGLRKENSELRAQKEVFMVEVDGLKRENSELHVQKQALENEMQLLRDRLPSAQLFAEFKHSKEHENAKIVLIDNSKGVQWDTTESYLSVTKYSVKKEHKDGRSIRSMRGFSTVPLANTSDLLVYNVHYYEVTIDELIPTQDLLIGLADENFPMGQFVGCPSERPFNIGINIDGTLYKSGDVKVNFGPNGFVKNDVVGCGLMVTQKTKTAEDAKCEPCIQQQRTVFFTKNGTAIPLPSDAPSMLYPTISIGYTGSKVTANFGHQPFKYAIPPAKGLNVCGRCCRCKNLA